jgi:menaquinone-dependent protoporphyrinogen oxidase
MAHVLLVHSTFHGSTTRIADRMADMIRRRGHLVTSSRAFAAEAIDFSKFDLVILGGPMHAGRYPPGLRELVHDRIDDLRRAKVAFFSVSMSAAGSEADREEAHAIAVRYLHDVGLHALVIADIAGTLSYTKYNPLMRWVIKRISAGKGGPTDTHHDYELTNWREVENFVDRALAQVKPVAVHSGMSA